MTFSDRHLLNTATLHQLLQLEAKIPEFLDNQLNLLLERWPLYVTELQEFLKVEDFSQAADLCHKIKGHCGMLGFNAVHVYAEELESTFRESTKSANCHLILTNLNKVFTDSFASAQDWSNSNRAK